MQLKQGSIHKAQRPAANTERLSKLAAIIIIIPPALHVRDHVDSPSPLVRPFPLLPQQPAKAYGRPFHLMKSNVIKKLLGSRNSEWILQPEGVSLS